MEKLTLKEIQKVEFDLLCTAVDFLEKNGLDYMLAYGTLLGAVRHNGFIPWDDDIDILMPRADYERLKALIRKGAFRTGSIRFNLPGDKGYKHPFIKLDNRDYEVRYSSLVDEIKLYLWVDIFPIDHYPDDRDKCHRLAKRTKTRVSITDANAKKYPKKGNLHKKLVWCFSKCVAAAFGGYRGYARHVDRVGLWRDRRYRSSRTFADGTWALKHSFYDRDILFPTAKDPRYPFEGREFLLPADWDKVLSIPYHDYMTLPPVEERATHLITVYKTEKE